MYHNGTCTTRRNTRTQLVRCNGESGATQRTAYYGSNSKARSAEKISTTVLVGTYVPLVAVVPALRSVSSVRTQQSRTVRLARLVHVYSFTFTCTRTTTSLNNTSTQDRGTVRASTDGILDVVFRRCYSLDLEKKKEKSDSQETRRPSCRTVAILVAAHSRAFLNGRCRRHCS